MDHNSESGSPRAEKTNVTVEECKELCNTAEGNQELESQPATQSGNEAIDKQADGGRTADTVRSGLSNFKQSASRTTGQIRELLENSKALDRDLVDFLQDPNTKAFMDGAEEEDDDDNNGLDDVDEASSDNPKEVEALKQKTKSLKRKLRKWRKAARMALSEICPDISADAQGDMTPGTMKNVLQKIRQLKALTDRQTSIILTLKNQLDVQKSEGDEKDALIMELLRNCNGIRPTLVKDDQSQAQEKIRSGACSIEGMYTTTETNDYPLLSASDFEEVLSQTNIIFGSVPEITRQINRDADSSRGKQDNSEQAQTISVVGRNLTDADAKSEEEAVLPDNPRPSSVFRQATLSRKNNVWWGVAVGAAAGLGSVIMGNIGRKHAN